MASFDDLYDFVLPYLPGAEPGVVDLHINRALREFLTRTTVWREVFEFTTAAAASTYQLEPTQGRVSSILSVEIDGTPARVLPEERRGNPAPGRATHWYGLVPSLLNLYPTPAGEQAVRVEAALTLPLDGSVREFPTEVFQEHGESLAAGAIASMMQMPGKPWSQRDAAVTYGRAFGSAIRDTRAKLRDGGQPNQSTFRGPRFGA